jgi:hypothetical protein
LKIAHTNPREKTLLGRPRCRWEESIKRKWIGSFPPYGLMAISCEYGRDVSDSINMEILLVKSKFPGILGGVVW